MEIRRGLPSDYDVMLNHVVQSFRENNPCHLRFEHLFPDVINASPETMGYWRFAFIDGEMAAGIELIPRQMKIGDAEFTSGGIGNVHCWQKFRKSGCFSALLNRIIEDMNQEGWGLGLLGGDRTRYGNYGWEPAGVARRMNLSSHIVRFEDLGPAPSVTAFRDYRGDDEDAKKMWQAHMEKNVRCTRPTLEKFKLALARPSSVTYINETTEEGFAYVTVRGGNITEYAGSTAAVERILRYLLKSGGWGVEVPPVSCSGPTEEMFLCYASGYGINTTAMVRVNSMCRVLNDYAPWLRRRLENWTGERIIELEDGEKVSIFRKGEAMVISETNRIANVKLTRREVARLFFGPFMPDLGCQQEDDFWRLAFPLPLFWAGPDHV